LDRRFPGQCGFKRLIRTIKLVRNFSYTLVDPLVLSLFGSQSIEQSCPEHDQLVELSRQSGGLIILQTHAGSWQSGMRTLGQFEKSVAIVLIDDGPTAQSGQFKDAQLIDPRDGLACAMQMSESLLAGNALALMGDRMLGGEKNVLPAKFLGEEVLFPVTPYRLASATGAPILVMMAPRLSHCKCELRLARMIRVPPGLGRNPQAFAPYLQEYVKCLENFVREYPWQFFNFFDLWNKNGT
jgi:predicted LPLAT superfamily acyltransferase